jgi:hypothetical protein
MMVAETIPTGFSLPYHFRGSENPDLVVVVVATGLLDSGLRYAWPE